MKNSLLARVLRDVASDRTRKTISPEQVSACCRQVGDLVRRVYAPDIVVAIDTGGSLAGDELGRILSIPVAHLTVKRQINMERQYRDYLPPIRLIMSLYHHFLFQIRRPIIVDDMNVDVYNKKVLLVDDTMHTGASVEVTTSYLERNGATQIMVACLAYVSQRKPDFSVLPPGNYSFPWSRDYYK